MAGLKEPGSVDGMKKSCEIKKYIFRARGVFHTSFWYRVWVGLLTLSL